VNKEADECLLVVGVVLPQESRYRLFSIAAFIIVMNNAQGNADSVKYPVTEQSSVISPVVKRVLSRLPPQLLATVSSL
jgi:hypothetical protein